MEKIIKSSKASGFSLIEMLVVITVFSILAILSTQSLATSLRGTRKSESIGHVRENIEYAMTIMERSLRTASDLECPLPATPHRLEYRTSSNIVASFECAGGNIASSSGGVVTDLIVGADVRIIGCGTDTMFTCNKGTGGNPDSVVIRVAAQEVNNAGAESALYTSETRILLRNY